MSKERACKQCKSIFEGAHCPKCNSQEFTESFKGKVVVLNAENSEVAKNLKIKDKGKFTIKLG
jgi:DNA-directed RNA polymerase subunit E"